VAIRGRTRRKGNRGINRKPGNQGNRRTTKQRQATRCTKSTTGKRTNNQHRQRTNNTNNQIQQPAGATLTNGKATGNAAAVTKQAGNRRSAQQRAPKSGKARVL